MQHIGNKSVVKIVLVVSDIEKKVDTFASLFGIERPRVVLSSPPAPGSKAFTDFRGDHVSAPVKMTTFQMGPIGVELLEPLDDKSPWAEHLRKRGEGIFSVVWEVEGFEDHIEMMGKRGLPLYHLGEYGSGRYAYFETLSALGITLGLQNKDKRF
jgi:methylmalonyl-CoA/ethylmalonyl-CoA epimerase